MSEVAGEGEVDRIGLSFDAEVERIRGFSNDAFLVTPGVRLEDEVVADQKRVQTPRASLEAGSSALVIGRPIVDAKDPVEAMDRILASIQAVHA